MIRRLQPTVAVLITLLVFFAAPILAGDGTLSAEERAQVVKMLEDSRNEFEALVAQVDAEHWNHRTDPERWAVGEVVEHLVLAEEGFHVMISGAMQGETNPEWEAIAAQGVDGVVGLVQDRSQKFQAPDNLSPSGEWSREDALARFAKARATMLDFTRSVDAAVKMYTIEGPPGSMNVHQWLALCGAHNLRHNQQIQDVVKELHKG